MDIEKLKEHIIINTPSGVLTRKKIEELTFSIIKSQFLANIDSDKTRRGIEGGVLVGKTIVYSLDAVLDFLDYYFGGEK